MEIPLTSIRESTQRIREVERDESFNELVESIRTHGLLQPIKIRPYKNGYEIVYGHRRVAAMRSLGWTKCEALVDEVDDEEALIQAVLENLQRKDLTIFEEAQIYSNLRAKGLTNSQISQMVNKPDGQISNRLSLLRLPAEVQDMVQPSRNQQIAATEFGVLSVDSASRISAAVKEPDEAVKVARKVVQERLTSSEIRQLTAELKQVVDPNEREEMLIRPFAPYPLMKSVSEPEQPYGAESSKPFHTADRSISEQFHAKLVWNLQRIDLEHYTHFTIGYSQRTWDQVKDLIQLARITMLVDARKNPVSQYKPEFSRNILDGAAKKAGIKYLNVPELGIGSEDRAELADTHNYDRLFDTYSRRLGTKGLRSLLGRILETERVAFLCVELDPNTCHRSRIALLLEDMGFRTLDL